MQSLGRGKLGRKFRKKLWTKLLSTPHFHTGCLMLLKKVAATETRTRPFPPASPLFLPALPQHVPYGRESSMSLLSDMPATPNVPYSTSPLSLSLSLTSWFRTPSHVIRRKIDWTHLLHISWEATEQGMYKQYDRNSPGFYNAIYCS